ncbi:MAG: hypothetical protein M3417_04110 [Actinomycetota bacterium]|nr:hypothetical protein [Actinomycetota bacterium]
MTPVTHVLVVANRTAATPALLEAVRARAESSPCRFYLVVPATPKGLHRLVDPEDSGKDVAAQNLELALPLLSDAAGSPVEGHVGDASPLSTIEDAVHQQPVDEILISTLPARVSRWLHLDLVSKARALGRPVKHVEASAPVTAAA